MPASPQPRITTSYMAFMEVLLTFSSVSAAKSPVHTEYSITYFSKKQNGKSGEKARKRPPKGGLTGEDSASLLKAGAAAAAGDGDFSLAPGDTQLLAAVGAFEVAVFLVSVCRALKAPPADHGAGHLEKLCVFSPAAGGVAGEGTKQEKEKAPPGTASTAPPTG